MSDSPAFKCPLDTRQIQKIIPHRYPFLFIDRVLELDPGKSIKAIKCVSQNEAWTQGHLPGNPIMPGVLQVETMAQAGAIMVLSLPKFRDKIAVLGEITRMRFRRLVVPGDVMAIDVELISLKLGVGRAQGQITVDGETVVEGQIRFAFTDL